MCPRLLLNREPVGLVEKTEEDAAVQDEESDEDRAADAGSSGEL